MKNFNLEAALKIPPEKKVVLLKMRDEAFAQMIANSKEDMAMIMLGLVVSAYLFGEASGSIDSLKRSIQMASEIASGKSDSCL